MKRPPRLHQEMLDRAVALASGDGTWTPPIARPASTVVLMKDTPEGLSTYLMRRVLSMAFAAGMHVFPGGRIDDADIAADVEFTGDPLDAERMSADPDLARGTVVGALREVFEETGVLLAVDAQGRHPLVDGDWERDREAVNQSSAAFGEVLRRRGLVIDPRVMPLWSHWITPEVEERRYDVRFFVARVPPEQDVHDVSGEADHVVWVRPPVAVAEYHEDRMTMLPPTVSTLTDLSAFDSVAQVLAAAEQRQVRPYMPRPRMGIDELIWEVVDARDGTVLWDMGGPPPDSEVRGVN